MSEWKEHKINDIVVDYLDFRGKTPRKLGMDWGNGNIKALSANNVGKGKIDFNKECYLGSEELYKIWMNKGDCHKGDVLITMEAPLGNVAQIPDDKKYILSQRTLLFKTQKEIVNNDFFFYVLSDREFQDELQKNSTGSTVTGIQQKKLARLKVKLPALATQAKIAKILTTCDAVIEQTQSAIAKYKAIKHGILHDLFTRGLDASGKLRPTSQQAPELYKDSELGMIPNEWEVKIMDKLCDLVTDGSHFSPKPLEVGKLIANVKDFQEYGINYDSCTKISIDEFNLLKNQNCSPKKGDVLLSKDGTVGKVILFNNDIEIVILSSIAILRPTAEILSKFLYTYLKSEYFNTQLIVKMSGSALKRIVLRDIKSLLVAFPMEKQEQEMISERLVKLELKLKSEEALLSKYQSIKRGLMGDLLSGKKVV